MIFCSYFSLNFGKFVKNNVSKNIVLFFRYIDTLQKCSVIKLEACSDPTPANIVESLFDFIKKTTPCGGILKQAKASAQISEPVNSAATIFATMITTVILMVSTRVL